MSSHLTKRALLCLTMLGISHHTLAQENGIISSKANDSNPFEFKPKEPPKTVPVENLVLRDDNLSSQQRDIVANMIKKAVDAIQMNVPESNEISIDGDNYILLKSGDRYLGVTSGMFVVFSKMKNDYSYHDTRKYKRVMTEAEYTEISEKSKSNLDKVIETVREIETPSDTPVNILSKDEIRPLPLSSKDD